MDLGAVIIGGVTGNTTFWVGNVGGDPRMAKNLGGFHHQVTRRITGMPTPLDVIQRKLVLPTTGRHDEGGGDGGTGDLHHQES